jgi:hypothetical protein
MKLIWARVYDLALKMLSARFAAFMGTEAMLWQGLDEKEAMTKFATILGQVLVGGLYLWSETIRPTLSGFINKVK